MVEVQALFVVIWPRAQRHTEAQTDRQTDSDTDSGFVRDAHPHLMGPSHLSVTAHCMGLVMLHLAHMTRCGPPQYHTNEANILVKITKNY